MNETSTIQIEFGVADMTREYHSVKLFFPGYYSMIIREPQPGKAQKAPYHRSQTPSTENPNPKTQYKTPTPKTTINERNKIIKNNPGKKYSVLSSLQLCGSTQRLYVTTISDQQRKN